MTKITYYTDEWRSLKRKQRVWVDKYNKSISVKMKKKYYIEIMLYETKFDVISQR